MASRTSFHKKFEIKVEAVTYRDKLLRFSTRKNALDRNRVFSE